MQANNATAESMQSPSQSRFEARLALSNGKRAKNDPGLDQLLNSRKNKRTTLVRALGKNMRKG